MERRETTTKGQTLVWQDTGPESGAAVVLVHGFPDGPDTWTPFAQRLADEGFRVLAPALRGYAPRTAVPGERSTGMTAGGDVIALLDHVGIQRAAVVGHDWGASAAYGAAALAPERISRLVPIGVPHPRASKLGLRTAWAVRHFFALGLPGGRARLARRDGAYLGVLARRWAPTWADGPRSAHIAAGRARLRDPEVLDGVVAFYRDLFARPDRGAGRRTEVPGMVVAGRFDLDLFGEAAFRATPDAFTAPCTLQIIEDAGHWPHLEKPEEFEALVVPFLLEPDDSPTA